MLPEDAGSIKYMQQNMHCLWDINNNWALPCISCASLQYKVWGRVYAEGGGVQCQLSLDF